MKKNFSILRLELDVRSMLSGHLNGFIKKFFLRKTFLREKGGKGSEKWTFGTRTLQLQPLMYPLLYPNCSLFVCQFRLNYCNRMLIRFHVIIDQLFISKIHFCHYIQLQLNMHTDSLEKFNQSQGLKLKSESKFSQWKLTY